MQGSHPVLDSAQDATILRAKSSAGDGASGVCMASARIPPRNVVGPQIRRLRSQQGITQQAFAERCQRMGWDLSRDTLAKIEAQMRWLADFELVFIAEALSVPLDLLLPERGAVTQQIIREFVGRLSAGKADQ